MKKSKKTPKIKEKKKTKTTHEIVVRVEQPKEVVVKPSDLSPEIQGSKYMIPKSWLSEKQVIKMVQKTPPQHVYNRPAKGGGSWSYVTGNYVEKVLNFTFGWNWDFEVVSHGKEGDQVWVLGKLTVKDDHGHMITKTQFGRADVKFRRDDKTKIMLDFGNDLKSATTDALKKCASLLGIASDIYGKAEFKDIGVQIQETVKTIEPPKKAGEFADAITCSKCDGIMSPQERDFSMKIYKKQLCRDCQKDAKKN